MKLSILTPAVPSRLGALEDLCNVLKSQIGDRPVEHLVLLDNKRRSVGLKRDALLRAARGRYVAFCDDDDQVCDGYVDSILAATETDPDVITFEQESIINGQSGIIEFGLGNPNEGWQPGRRSLRNAWHVCAWKRTLAILSNFPDNSYGEDWAYAAKLCGISGLREVHIPRILHRYIHNSSTTEAPPPPRA